MPLGAQLTDERRTMPPTLIIGNAIPETIRRNATGPTTIRIGGVGAITAQELHRTGLDTTLLTTISHDAPGQTAQNLLRQQPFAVHTAPAAGTVGYTDVLTTAGEPQELDAVYPTISWHEISAAAIALIPQHDWVAADCNLDAAALREIAQRTPTHRLVINGTAPDRCRRILAAADYPKAAVTLNRSEAAILYELTQTANPGELTRQLNTQYLLITHDADGWLLAYNGIVSHHPAIPAPSDTDFIGAGDSATAGLIYALATGQPPTDHINPAIARRLQHNRLS